MSEGLNLKPGSIRNLISRHVPNHALIDLSPAGASSSPCCSANWGAPTAWVIVAQNRLVHGVAVSTDWRQGISASSDDTLKV